MGDYISCSRAQSGDGATHKVTTLFRATSQECGKRNFPIRQQHALFILVKSLYVVLLCMVAQQCPLSVIKVPLLLVQANGCLLRITLLSSSWTCFNLYVVHTTMRVVHRCLLCSLGYLARPPQYPLQFQRFFLSP